MKRTPGGRSDECGGSSPENLALACIQCNAWKGSDIASVGLVPERIVPRAGCYPVRPMGQLAVELLVRETARQVSVSAITIVGRECGASEARKIGHELRWCECGRVGVPRLYPSGQSVRTE